MLRSWFQGRGYDNNNNRILLMKRNLSAYLQEALRQGNPDPKIVFRFGSNHMQRGLTSVNVFDLGNMMSELAQFKRQKSIHILFSGLQGEQFNSLQGMQSYEV